MSIRAQALRHVATDSERAAFRHSAALLAPRWVALLAGAVLVARSGASPVDLLWGAPLLAFNCLRTAGMYVEDLRAHLDTSSTLILEVVVAALVVSRTGGWHSGWVATLVGVAALCGYSLPERWSGQVASAAVIALLITNLAAPDFFSAATRFSLNLDGLTVIAVLAVSYAAWLARYGDRNRAQLARTRERLTATNDLLVLLERTLLRGDEATDPQQAARAVARLARDLVHPDVVVVAALNGVGQTWRVLLSEGVTLPAMVDGLEVLSLASGAPAADTRPIRVDSERALISEASRAGVCLPLRIRGRLVGAVVLEVERTPGWNDRDYDLMAEMARWAALIVDNACRFNAMWVVGSAAERARVARNLHDNLGQSMAALGLELDWLARTMDHPDHVARIRELRRGVTAMVGELRFNMRDLCCDVSETRSLGEALDQLVRGVESRSRTRIRLDVSEEDRLPLALEHQVLQMARILLGAAVESRADAVELAWTSGGEGGCLELGFDAGSAAPGVRYESEDPMLMAIAEVRDRGWAVGATVECELGEEGPGRILCRVGM